MRHAMPSCKPNASRFAAMLLLSAALAPAPAQACSIDLSYFEFVSPMAYDVDVPTNAAIFVHGSATSSADVLELVDADGALVPFEARPVSPVGVEIIPDAELLPHREYTLWARWLIDETQWPPGSLPPSRASMGPARAR